MVTKECSVDSCSKLAKTQGWCGTHYARWWRNGTLETRIKSPRPSVKSACEQCGASIIVQANQLEQGAGRYCSLNCKHEAMRGRPSGRAVPLGTRRLRQDGYIEIKVDDTAKNWSLEHRVVVERMIGRSLASTEEVHHVNHNRADNRPENLEVVPSGEHQRLHAGEDAWKYGVLVMCNSCGITVRKKPSRVTEHNYCSNECRLRDGVAVTAMWATQLAKSRPKDT